MAARFKPHAPVLMVDDDALTRLLVATTLERAVYRVETAAPRSSRSDATLPRTSRSTGICPG